MLRRPAPPPRERDDRRRDRPEELAARPSQPRVLDERDGPELEVLRHVVHDWPSVEPWIRYEELFLSDLHAAAFRALMAHPTVQEAIDAADPGVADLLGRLATEEVAGRALRRGRAAAHRARSTARSPSSRSRVGSAVRSRRRCSRSSSGSRMVIDRLRDPDTAVEAADELVAFVGQQDEEGA